MQSNHIIKKTKSRLMLIILEIIYQVPWQFYELSSFLCIFLATGLLIKQTNFWTFLQKQKLIPVFGLLSDWHACFPGLPWPYAISSVARVQQSCCQYYANRNAEYNWAFFLFAFPFFNCCDFCSDVLSVELQLAPPILFLCKWFLHWGVLMGELAAPWSLGCLSDCPNPLLVLLEQLVPMWDWGDTADEVEQLAPVWSSKHRHTSQTEREGETERCRTRVYERHRTWRDGREIKNEIGSEWGK